MKITFKKLFLFILVAGTTVSCDLGPDKELDYGSGPFVTQFPFPTTTGYFLKDDSEIFNYGIPVELVGGNGLAIDSDIVITFDKIDYVDDPTTDLDDSYVTAVEGTDFEFVNPTNSITIPAGSTFASIPVRVLSGNLDDEHPSVLVLNITEVNSAGAVVASGNKSKINVILQGTCTSDLAKMYNLVTTRSTGAVYVLPDEDVVEIGTGKYLTSSTGPYNNRGLISAGAQLGTASAGFIFNEVCGRIALDAPQRLGGQLGGGYSNSVFQTPTQYAASSVDPVTGVITIEYSIWFASGDRQYRGVYTPQ
jgi:hypothetical protein